MRGVSGDDTPALARALTRLVVLPFRVLRPDPETDFLAFSLPDAIATSLSGIGSLVVRSSAVAARFAGGRAGPQGGGRRGRRGPRGDGHAAARRRAAPRHRPARRGPRRDAADLAHGAGLAGRPVPPPGRHRPPRRGGPVAAAGRARGLTHAAGSAQRARLRAVPARERAGALLRELQGGARPLPAVPGAGPGLRPGLGPPGPLPPRDRQVHRGLARQRRPRRDGLPPGASSWTRGSPWPTGSTRSSRPTWARRRPR